MIGRALRVSALAAFVTCVTAQAALADETASMSPALTSPAEAPTSAPAATSTPLPVRPTHTLIPAPDPRNLGFGAKLGLGAMVAAAGLWVITRSRKRSGGVKAPRAAHVAVVGRTGVGVRSELLVVEVDGQRMLLGVTPGSIQRLALLPDEDPKLAAVEPEPETVARRAERHIPEKASGRDRDRGQRARDHRDRDRDRDRDREREQRARDRDPVRDRARTHDRDHDRDRDRDERDRERERAQAEHRLRVARGVETDDMADETDQRTTFEDPEPGFAQAVARLAERAAAASVPRPRTSAPRAIAPADTRSRKVAPFVDPREMRLRRRNAADENVEEQARGLLAIGKRL